MERAELMAVLRATGCARERGKIVFLHDPVAKAAGLECHLLDDTLNGGSEEAEGWLCIATGGTSGRVKFVRHDEKTLSAAVGGFCAHFGIERVNAVDVLPPYHVSGLMARVRCAATGGEHVAWEWKELQAGRQPELGGGKPWVISLVPTQLQRLLTSGEATAWLRRFEIIFVGGGPLWAELAEAAARAELRLSPSYGMTETAAMVTAVKPEDFLAGDRTSGAPMPHARVAIDDARTITIAGESVFHGYFGEEGPAGEFHVIHEGAARAGRVFETEDLGRIDEQGRLQVLGRRDEVIITGGKKVQPGEVEAALRATGQFGDVAVLGVRDAEWGQAVLACYPAAESPDLGEVERALAASLDGFKRPKRFLALASWPRNAQGKLNRAELRRMVGK